MGSRFTLAALVALQGCGPAVKPAETGRAGGTKPNVGVLPAEIPKQRLLPDVLERRGVGARSPAGDQSLVGRMRVRVRPGGVIERADELLPIGRVVSSRLPARLGGGYVFLAVSARGTELWRSDDWLGALKPLVSFGTVADNERPIVVGFDRLYVRMQSNNEVVAIDPKTGATMDLGTLPAAPSLGEMVFLDGWRAVVDTDIAGTFATFDAGATWRRVEIAGRVRSVGASVADGDDGGDAVIATDSGTYRIDAQGHVAFRASAAPDKSGGTCASGDPLACLAAEIAPSKEAPQPLGKNPLRTALERGYPDGPTSAVVASRGRLARVSLEDGAILAVSEHAYADEHADCQGIALATGAKAAADQVGFVCGSASGPTTIYALERPLALREVMRFSGPRVVSESGQGALVVRGACGDEDASSAADAAASRPFCVRFVDGTTREVRIRGNVGAERVVAMRDGRVIILVPPRPGSQGQISILKGQSSRHVVLKMPDSGAPREVETGMWLEGFQESESDEIAGWIEAGGPVLGVRIKLSGEVTVGEVVDEPGGVLVSGRFGLALGDRGHLRESTDHGRTWAQVDLPSFDEPPEPPRARRCGPAGCALAGWLKVGWGDPLHEGDLKDATPPTGAKLSSFKLSTSALKLSCEGGVAESRPKPSGKKNQGSTTSSWLSFLEVEPPTLEKGDLGLDNGVPFDSTPMRAYVWGKKDADWGRSGRLLMRFGNRFALDQVRSSAITASPWPNDGVASDVMGLGTYGYTVQWSAQRDGDSALVGACRARVCSLFGVDPGEPVLSLRSSDPAGLPKPFVNGAVKLDKSWFYLGDTGNAEALTLYRSELGAVRQLATFRRLPSPRFRLPAPPRLVRRALGGGLGLLFTQRQGPTDRRGLRYVLPIDPESGRLGEPILLGRPDLSDATVSGSCGERDGWVVELPLENAPDVALDGQKALLESVELRMRLDPGTACIDAGVGTLSSLLGFEGEKRTSSTQKNKKAPPESGFPVILADRNTASRKQTSCAVR